MNERIVIITHITKPGKKTGKHIIHINLDDNEPIENLNITSALWNHHIPDIEVLIKWAIQDYLEKNEE